MATRVDQAHPMTETELQGIVVRMAEERGWAVHENGNTQGSQNKPRRPSRRKGQNGFPDLTLARDTELLFLELKTQTGVVDADQTVWMIALPTYEVIRPSDLARGRVDELLG